MTVNAAAIWLIIGIVSFSLSGISLVATIFMFIKMNIPAVIGSLTGKTVAKEIKAMRDAGASIAAPINHNRAAEELSDDVTDSSVRTATHVSSQTAGILSVDENRETDILIETALLSEARQTNVLSQFQRSNGAVDNFSVSETTILSDANGFAQDNIKPVAFRVTRSVIEIHTDEVI